MQTLTIFLQMYLVNLVLVVVVGLGAEEAPNTFHLIWEVVVEVFKDLVAEVLEVININNNNKDK